MTNSLRRLLNLTVLTLAFPVAALAQNNPIPQVVGPVHPMAVAPGSGAFTLSVYGANFVPGAVVSWNYQPRTTTFVSAHEVQSQILASDVAKATAGFISVTNPVPGGGDSSASWAQLEVHAPISTIVVSPPAYYYFGYWAMLAADFNHDGVLDLAGEYNGLSLDIGKGDGTFRLRSDVSRKYLDTTQFVYGDFNGDGNLDLAFDDGNVNTNQVTHMSVMLGDGKGRFSVGPTITAYGGLGRVVVGDFNQDGKLDLLTAGEHSVSEFLGNGDGSFQHVANYPYSLLANDMKVGDFNGDGKLDLILMQISGSGITLWFLQGNGDGTFKPPQEIASFPGADGCGVGAPQGGGVQLSDFNGDGKLDLAFCTKSQVGILMGNGDGTFQPPVYYTADSTGQGLFTYVLGDLNSDGNPDLVASEYSNFNSLLVVFLGNGDGTFQPGQTISSAVPSGELGITLGDFNSDGMLDVIFQNGVGMNVFLQQ
ncbi:MAG TPA: VCBS repeat-containing protein [Candidatus Sulfotelmatobacter sp.]